MNKMFSVDKKSLREVIGFWKKNKRDFPKATANVLSTFAFDTKKENIKIIHRKMVARNKKFIENSIQIEKASHKQSVSSQKSKVGSVKRDRFTGWIEQETGKKPLMNRTIQMFARGNNIQKQVKPSMRLQKALRPVLPDGFPGNSDHNRVNAMMAILKRKKYKKTFIIKGHKRLPKGLYKFWGGEPTLIQNFDERMPVPKPVKWLSGGVKSFFESANMGKIWKRAIESALKFKKRR